MMIETSRGPIDAAKLSLERTTQDVPAGKLETSTYRLGDEIVKIDQKLHVSEATCLEAFGIARLPTPFN